jgi:type VI secretion system protein ImpA
MNPPSAIELDPLLAPVAGDNPAGADLRYHLVYDQIRRTRKAAEDKINNPDEHAGQSPDEEWRTIQTLTTEALCQSKDLQLAVWLLETLTHVQGFEGAAAGLQLIRRLLESYWESLFPAIDAEDDEPLAYRVSVLQWINDKLPQILRTIPICDDPSSYSLLHYEVTQKTGIEKEALLESGWPSADQFERALSACALSGLERVLESIASASDELARLERLTDACFLHRTMSASGVEEVETLLMFRNAREVLDGCRWVVERAARKKRPIEKKSGTSVEDKPQPTDPVPTAEAVLPGPPELSRAEAGEIEVDSLVDGHADALFNLCAAAEFLLTDNRLDPTSYLVSRAVAFGVMFAYGELAQAHPLPSPPTAIRQHLRDLYAEERWVELLLDAEQFLRSNPKQPWLDLHRYVLTAMDRLGESYAGAAAAIRGQLRGLLAVHPGLLAAEFADGTSVANVDTQRWLTEEGLTGLAAATPVCSPPAPSHDGAATAKPIEYRPADEALAMVRKGRLADGLSHLQQHVSAAPSGRERFLRKVDLAELCVEAGRARLAFPILDELSATIERSRLDEWEDEEVIARVWVALLRCCQMSEGNPDAPVRTADAFARLCRLDVTRALSVEQAASGSPSRGVRR